MSILEKIIAVKHEEVQSLKSAQPFKELQLAAEAAPQPRGLAYRIANSSEPAIIAEIKRASPSKGEIRPDLDPIETAKAYAQNGAAAISVLTDEQFFSGSSEFIPAIRCSLASDELPSVPILRKDFIVDPYQVWQTRALGADAMLLIVAALSSDLLSELIYEAISTSLDVLIEVHNQAELLTAVKAISNHYSDRCFASRPLLGINNRDLTNFTVNLNTTRELAHSAREKLACSNPDSPFSNMPIVAESGIFTAADLHKLKDYGASVFLIGESLVRNGDPGDNLSALIAEYRN